MFPVGRESDLSDRSKSRLLSPPSGLLPLLALLVVTAFAAPGAADPDYGPVVLTGLDPVLKSTTDPRLLGEDRLFIREMLLLQGVDPARDPGMPTLFTRLRRIYDERLKVDLRREMVRVESSGFTGLVTVFRYPKFIFLFQSPKELPGGLVYYPPRDVFSPGIEIFIDDQVEARDRRMAVGNRMNRRTLLDINSGGSRAVKQEGLINLTIPIKLPRTLEKIIGRGEKTNIRISGRDHISISGESTVSNKFTPNERRKSQSLFPSMDMEQQLQINLAGQIGEKIHLEVDHNSQAMGPEATKIRLTFKGTEDDIIQSIESGDVGLTLPGSQLLGYSSSKSGLFGLKVAGQLGRADFTVVTSKQKAESASKAFNSKGGQVGDHVIEANRYLNNRFFRLDLPSNDYVAHSLPDVPGRDRIAEPIDLGSVRIYRFVGTGRQQDGDVRNIVAVPDSTGRWVGTLGLIGEGENAYGAFKYGELWRPVDFEILRDQDGNLVAVDLLREYDYHDVLVAIYDVGGPNAFRVGDYPGQDEDLRVEIDGDLYYRMKLLKPEIPEPRTWQYVLRNIYPLGGANIDAETFDLRIETSAPYSQPQLDQDDSGNGTGLDWFRIFGLDTEDQQGNPGADGIVDKHNPYIFDLAKGLLKFPLNFPEPFNAPEAAYAALAGEDFDFDTSLLSDQLIPEIYDPETTQADFRNYTQFKFISSHAAAASSFNLGVSNIEEGSESVTLDGRKLTRDVDYSIDYTFGQITLKGDAAAGLKADSQISVNYQYAPFMGGGNSSLLGFNVGLDVGRQNRFSTTWLYESNQVVGHKAKLGDEPSRNLVGNINGQFTTKPKFLTKLANLISRHDTDRESTLSLNGELAMRFPNPNTFNEVYSEDFEGIDASDLMPISRLSWSNASRPSHGDDINFTLVDSVLDGRNFQPENRLDTRWYLPWVNTLRRFLNPELIEQEARESQQVLEIFMKAEDGQWDPENWGGVMRGLGRSGIDLNKAQFLEFWVNDYRHEALGNLQTGTLHFDFGYINEDFYWKEDDLGNLEIGNFDREDGINGDGADGVFTIDEDIGLGGDPQGDRFSADLQDKEDPYPRINGTAMNNKEDTEDLDGDSVLDKQDGFFSISVALSDSALIDVLRDYPADAVTDNIEEDLAWRKYRIRLGDALPVSPPSGTKPSLANVTHIRIWFEEDDPPEGQDVRRIQLSDVKFVGSRWEREGVRRVPTPDAPEELLLTGADLGIDENFFIGEVNNKDNHDYVSPFPLYIQNKIPEKEQSLVLDYQNLAANHMVRASRVLSPVGDDYSLYKKLTWYVYNPRVDQAAMDIFFRLGADTLNYYEINYRFDESRGVRSGWKELRLDMARLSNAKLEERNPETGWIETKITDSDTGDEYRVRVVGAPDLRRIKRYYLGVRNTDHQDPVSGYFYFNDVRLREVKKDSGHAERVAARLNMADVVKVDVDWSRQDSDFHGLDKTIGAGTSSEDLNVSSSLKLNDFIPLLGFDLPLSFSRQHSTKRPKYMTNSDIEIIDDLLREEQTSLNERESFSVRLARSPSQNVLARYILDPWQFSLSGARTNEDTPLNVRRSKNLQGSVSYDLRISGKHVLGDFPVIGRIPVVRGASYLPNKISVSANYSGDRRESSSFNIGTGEFDVMPTNRTKRGSLNGSFEYKPLKIVDLNVTLRSDRDPFRVKRIHGVNIGEETIFNQKVQMNFRPPSRMGLPDNWFFRPISLSVRELNKMKPNLSFNSTYGNNRSPSVRQADDPPGVGNMTVNGEWTFRVSVPLNKAVSQVFPKKLGMSKSQQRAMIEQERKLRSRGRGQDTSTTGDEDPAMSDSERRRQEEEALLEQALERRAEAAVDTAGAGEPGDPADWDAAPPATARRISIPNPFEPVLELMRNTNPIQISYSLSERSDYSRFRGDAPFWYRMGFQDRLDLPDSLYVSQALQDRSMISLSTSAKISRAVSLDVKYNKTESTRTNTGLESRNYSRDWPDLRLSIGNIEKLGFLGGGGRESRLKSANLDISYKYNQTINNWTETAYNPRVTKQFTPRLSMSFRNGMSSSLNLGFSGDESDNNGTLTTTNRINASVQFKHSFQAQAILARLGLYRPGAIPKVNMDAELSWSRNTTDRWLPGSDRKGEADTVTGSTRISMNPRFSYQISRNLSGALRLIFSRDKTIETDTVTKRFGLGLEATFVF